MRGQSYTRKDIVIGYISDTLKVTKPKKHGVSVDNTIQKQ